MENNKTRTPKPAPGLKGYYITYYGYRDNRRHLELVDAANTEEARYELKKLHSRATILNIRLAPIS